jgi:hypothetical protein
VTALDALTKTFLLDFPAEPGAPTETLAQLISISGVTLPADYLNVLAEMNGGEGFVGRNYLVLWKAEELVQFNIEYELDKYAPGLLLFGSNGGGEGFGFDTRSGDYEIVMVPLIGMELKYAHYLADSFLQFLDVVPSNDSLPMPA